MQYKLIIFLSTFFIAGHILAQQPTYTVQKASFCSDKYDEYCPVYYKSGIVFSSNRGSGSFVNYSSSLGQRTFDIFFVDTTTNSSHRKAKIFSKTLKTPLNDGPVTFNSSGDTIYFTRNLQVEGTFANLSNPRNKLGIFSAIREEKKWIKIREMRFNNEWYNATTPCLSPDETKLYFASDKSGGYGGSDLYYCQWKGDYWGDPANLGPVINTEGNEAYPFINQAGDIFFASDGHPGMGGKDIFFSRFADSVWLKPVQLDAPVNSQYDDFGFITDSVMNSGYFSSNREKSTDIYSFKTIVPQLFYSNLQRETKYCFKFSDEGNIVVDNNIFRYEWDFGDGGKASGQNTEHCYAGPGIYTVILNIINRNTGRIFFSKLLYNLELKNVEQPYIKAPEACVAGETVELDGSESDLPDYDILSYTWYFSNKERASGIKVEHAFNEKGIQDIKLGLIVRNKLTGITNQKSVTKKISVFDNMQEVSAYSARLKDPSTLINIRDYDQAEIKVLYSAEKEVTQEAEFVVELMTSKERVTISNNSFRNIPSKYDVKEILLPDENLYSYIVEREMDLMFTLPAYNDIISVGYTNVRIRTLTLKDPAEKEIHKIKKIFGLSADIFFDNYNRLTSNAYMMLDQMARVLSKYPDIKLEIAVHTDNAGSSQGNLQVSQGRAKTMFIYLVNKGIDPSRIISQGIGRERPVASNNTEAGRKLNRRVDFTVVKE